MKKITAALLGAGQRGMDAYGSYALDNPRELQFVAVAEPDINRRNKFAGDHGITMENTFTDWQDLLKEEKLADALLVCTQDDMHFQPAMEALKKGYHILLEKPISNDPAECLLLEEAAEKAGRYIIVCHVLRYTSFFSQTKRLLEKNEIGEVVSIQHIEKVAFWHQAHSFVRGNWRNSKESSPMILSKSCHDMDILHWLAGKSCISISSFGSLSHFTEKNAPPGAPQYCLEGCPHRNDCPYYAPSAYLNSNDDWQAAILRKTVSLDTSDEAILAALKNGPYGRCVYHCDNDVVDHQVVIMQFADDVTVSFTMSAFTAEGGREIVIMGTKGELRGDMEKNEIEITDFLTQTRQVLTLKTAGADHGGGDTGIMKDLVHLLQEGKISPHISTISSSVESHLMAFAAEKSRLANAVVTLSDFAKEVRNSL
ncbi:MAG: Gfo/Idh/MocA family oxidoreductase [Bacteroidetes bacterium]|nr:Gfo/Idh/MocA family oxidoreductase [Bacteroidota bacterium]